jgi:putative sigma-54 modulation protein
LQIRVTGRHVEVEPKVKQYAEEKLGRLVRFFNRVTSVELLLESTKETQRAELVAHMEHNAPVVGHADKPDVITAIDEALEKVERQLKKHKEIVRDGKKHTDESLRHRKE